MAELNIFLDMDNVLVDTLSTLDKTDPRPYKVEKPDQIPNIFLNLKPMPGAVDAVKQLNEHFKLYVLSTASWQNASAWQDKLNWLEKYFGNDAQSPFYKRVVMAHDKGLVRHENAILIDDRPYHGASDWERPELDQHWIQYGYQPELTWENGLADRLIQLADAETFADGFQAQDFADRHGSLTDFKKSNWE